MFLRSIPPRQKKVPPCPFTGILQSVTQLAGKTLVITPPKPRGRDNGDHDLGKRAPGHGPSWMVMAGLIGALALMPETSCAHNGELFHDEIGKVEQLFTGGYMRLGLLAVCGMTAMIGAMKQNASIFICGILSGVFAYFMKDWILKTFSLVI